tara:strand:+ start:2016 stop:4904 length:2889 start_codon:yes stop_codon:yes gene_type:complete
MKEGSYNYREIEKKWRERWLADKTFKTANPNDDDFDSEKPKCYILDMFPYPSGSGLHIGHPKGYIASDIYTRFKRMQGFNVLHPMGFDSFGLPAEQYAIEHNVHPAIVTEDNIDTIRKQLQFLGLAYDWDREIATSREDYYKWTQWIFLQIFNSWLDPFYNWKDSTGRKLKGKARPIAELIEEFESGNRKLSDKDIKLVEAESTVSWQSLSVEQRETILNNYRLAYQEEVIVNWCPGLGTVLSNEEVTSEGKSERGNYPVYKRPLRQWMMRITAYAERLLEDLDADKLPDGRGGGFSLDWPEPVKIMQRNWIGRSEGAQVDFPVIHPLTGKQIDVLNVFTTRPDTLFGATFMVVAPEHPLINSQSDRYLVPENWPSTTEDSWKGDNINADIRSTVEQYVRAAISQTAVVRDEKEKTGVFTGITAVNPVNKQIIPIFVADYVSMDYGSGAIMAVPAHDERDYDFAQKYSLPILSVVVPPDGIEDGCFVGEGVSINSPVEGDSPYSITGLATAVAKKRMTDSLEKSGIGKKSVHYKLRDWIFSRQRYWGEPFPIATLHDGRVVGIDPPVILPEMDDFRPITSDDPNMPVSSPLGRAPESWRKVNQNDVGVGDMELNVMPQWAGSCWYYLRFIDPANHTSFCATDRQQYFMPVDLYIGGAEHAVLHLLYARFWHKVLFDLDLVGTPEPFKKLFNQGMITADAFADQRGVYIDIREVDLRENTAYHAKTGEKLQRFSGKMGKRFKNGLPPEEVGDEFGVDTLRLYEMYMGPLEASAPWSMEGIRGMQRFLQRVWRNFIGPDRQSLIAGDMTDDLRRLMHKTIMKVTEHIEGLRFNTAIASLIEFNNELVGIKAIPEDLARNYLKLLNPLAPHICEEIWEIAFDGNSELATGQWPEADPSFIVDDIIVLPIQVNGKMRGNIEVPTDIGENELKEKILEIDAIKRYVSSVESIKRFVLVPNRIVNIVV